MTLLPSFFLVLQLHPLYGYDITAAGIAAVWGFTQGRNQRATLFALAIDITYARCQSCDKARSCRTELNQEFAWLVRGKFTPVFCCDYG
jgi:hypothetical protein